MTKKTWLWLALAGAGYYLWKQGRVRVVPSPGAVTANNLRVYHTGSIDIPVDALTAILGTAIRKFSPF